MFSERLCWSCIRRIVTKYFWKTILERARSTERKHKTVFLTLWRYPIFASNDQDMQVRKLEFVRSITTYGDDAVVLSWYTAFRMNRNRYNEGTCFLSSAVSIHTLHHVRFILQYMPSCLWTCTSVYSFDRILTCRICMTTYTFITACECHVCPFVV